MIDEVTTMIFRRFLLMKLGTLSQSGKRRKANMESHCFAELIILMALTKFLVFVNESR
jgi:hypothetical protein